MDGQKGKEMTRKQNAINHINQTLIPKLKRSHNQRGTRSDHVDLLIQLIRQQMSKNDIKITEINYNELGNELLKRRLKDG